MSTSAQPLKPSLTLCPYSKLPLVDIANKNREHIIPIGLGGKDAFWLWADERMNTRVNDDIEASFIGSPLVRLLCASHDVRSRSGDVVARLRTTIKETGDDAIVTFGPEGLTLRFHKSVDKDGSTYTVKEFDEAAEKRLAAVVADLKKKGMVAEILTRQTIERPTIQGSLEVDVHLMTKQLAKIAYLMAVRTFGDPFTSSAGARQFREFLLPRSDVDGHAQAVPQVPLEDSPCLPQPQEREHLAFAVANEDYVICGASLFGAFAMCFVVPAHLSGVESTTGCVYRLNLDTQQAEESSFIQEIRAAMRRGGGRA